MSLASIHKKFLRALGRNALFIARRIISRLPYQAVRLSSPVFIAIGRNLIKKKKRIILDNLHIAFGGEKTEQEINGIVNSWFDSIGSAMIELMYFLNHPQKITGKVVIEGKVNLDEALKKGQGAILLSAHFGNFPLMLWRMALAGYKTNCIMRRMRDEQFEKYVSDFGNENGVRTIYSMPRRRCVEHSLKILQDNQILFILLDQNYGEDGGVFVEFFGELAATATGPVIFSYRSGAPILPVFIVRDGPDRNKVIIGPPVKLKAAQCEESGLQRNTAQLTKIIEGYIRRYPQEWIGWMHRRWKSKPAAS